MSYNLEKYRDKREKVLGVKKRGISFGTLAMLVSLVIVIGLAGVVAPRSITALQARHLDDAIFKMPAEAAASAPLLDEVRDLPGVKEVALDSNGHRIVVTYHRSRTNADQIASFFRMKRIPVVLLNTVDHGHRLHTLKKEAQREAL